MTRRTHKSVAAESFKKAVCQGRECEMKSEQCSGPLDAAHWVPAQRIRIHLSQASEQDRIAAVYDPRVARPLCRRHHHEIDHGFRARFYEDLPPDVFEWAREWGMEWSLERDYPSLEELRGVV